MSKPPHEWAFRPDETRQYFAALDGLVGLHTDNHALQLCLRGQHPGNKISQDMLLGVLILVHIPGLHDNTDQHPEVIQAAQQTFLHVAHAACAKACMNDPAVSFPTASAYRVGDKEVALVISAPIEYAKALLREIYHVYEDVTRDRGWPAFRRPPHGVSAVAEAFYAMHHLLVGHSAARPKSGQAFRDQAVQFLCLIALYRMERIQAMIPLHNQALLWREQFGDRQVVIGDRAAKVRSIAQAIPDGIEPSVVFELAQLTGRERTQLMFNIFDAYMAERIERDEDYARRLVGTARTPIAMRQSALRVVYEVW